MVCNQEGFASVSTDLDRRTAAKPTCTSTVNNSSRFSPMVNSRFTKRFDEAPICPKLSVAVAVTGSVASAGASAADETAENHPDADANGDGLVGMLMHGLVSHLGAFDGFLANAAIDFLAAFQCGRETLAGFADFFSGHIGGGRHQGLRVFGERSHVTAG